MYENNQQTKKQRINKYPKNNNIGSLKTKIFNNQTHQLNRQLIFYKISFALFILSFVVAFQTKRLPFIYNFFHSPPNERKYVKQKTKEIQEH